jgi:hypothetical protein
LRRLKRLKAHTPLKILVSATQKRGLILLLFLLLVSASGSAQKVEPAATYSPKTQEETTSKPSPTASPSPQSVERVGLVELLTIRNWTTDTWTAIAAIVAFIALVQPWLLGLWRKFFRRGTVEIHEAGKLEIGFSGYGHTLGLAGILRSLHKDMFVQWIKLQLVKKIDGSVREFEWKAFRIPKLTFGTTGGQSVEVSFDLPLSLMITPLQPHRFKVLFADEASLQPALPAAQKMQQEWVSRIQRLGMPKLDVHVLSQPQLLKKLRTAFSHPAAVSETYEHLMDLLHTLNYWQSGKYQLTMILQTARPAKTIRKTWSFTLPEAELEKLHNDVDSILEEVCGMPLSAGEYNFINVPFNS